MAGTLAAAVAAIVFPIAAAVELAKLYSVREQQRQAAQLARELLRRMEKVSGQMGQVFQLLEAGESVHPCDDDNMQRMARFTMENSAVIAVGHVHDNRLMCSAFGSHGNGIPLGPPDYLSQRNQYIWSEAKLPGLADKTYLVVVRQSSGYAAILDSVGPTEPVSVPDGASLGLYGLQSQLPILQRGQFEPSWANRLTSKDQMQFLDGQTAVALERSQRYDYAAYATVSALHVNESWRDAMLMLAPLGIAAGFVLAFFVLRLLQRQNELPAQLRRALQRGELFVVYQPIVALDTGRWIGAEALVRWRRPDGSLVPPDVFIPVAEQHHLASQVTARVIDLLARDSAQVLALAPDFHFSLNYSADDFQSPHTAALLGQAIARGGLRSRNVHVEVTERVLVNTLATAAHLKALRQQGICVAIDDFGTGYSSLSYLTQLEVDTLKIDKIFVDTIGTGAVTSQVVTHIIEMAKALRLNMTAEGVETRQQADYLRAHGVRFAQGWLFAKAMDVQALCAGLAEQQQQQQQPAAPGPLPAGATREGGGTPL